MDAFLSNIALFPTSFYTIGLVVVLSYWFIVMLGLFDIEFFDVEVDMDIDADVGQVGGIVGLLYSLGLTGVPISVVISFLVLCSWVICYLLSRFLPDFPELFSIVQLAIDTGILVVSFLLSIPLTARLIRPLKRFFRKLNQAPISTSIIGKTCKVRSSRVDRTFGEAECNHEGASLIIKVRSQKDEIFRTRELVVIIQHNEEDNTYIVISEKEFNQNIEN